MPMSRWCWPVSRVSTVTRVRLVDEPAVAARPPHSEPRRLFLGPRNTLYHYYEFTTYRICLGPQITYSSREPQVAFLELANENGLMHAFDSWGGGLDGLDPLYGAPLRAAWNRWLADPRGGGWAISNCHFRKTATGYDRKPGIKWLSCAK